MITQPITFIITPLDVEGVGDNANFENSLLESAMRRRGIEFSMVGGTYIRMFDGTFMDLDENSIERMGKCLTDKTYPQGMLGQRITLIPATQTQPTTQNVS